MGTSFEEFAAKCPTVAHLHPDHPDHPSNARPSKPKRSKYGAVRTRFKNRTYASKAEATHAQLRDWELSQGIVAFVLPQPKFVLGDDGDVYVSDFLVVYPDVSIFADEVKGVETPKFRRDRQLWAKYGPCPLRIYKRGKLVETIVPQTTE